MGSAPAAEKRVANRRPSRPENVSDALWQAVQLRQKNALALWRPPRFAEPFGIKWAPSDRLHQVRTMRSEFGHCYRSEKAARDVRMSAALVPGNVYEWPPNPADTELESQLFSELRKAVLQPASIAYVLDQFTRQLDSARVNLSQEKERTRARKKELGVELTRLPAAVAASGHSASLLAAIADRKRELNHVEASLRQEDNGFGKSSQELQQFALQRLSSLPDLLFCDVPRTRAELARHITHITMHPAEQNGDRRYTWQGDLNLLGSLAGRAFGWLRGPATIRTYPRFRSLSSYAPIT